MGKKRRNSRDAPLPRNTRASVTELAFIQDARAWETLIEKDYRPVCSCPEVQTCIGVYADLISLMTIHLMASGETGDRRIKNGLSRKLDIDPNHDMTRSVFIQHIVRTLMTYGNQVTIPVYEGEYLADLIPLNPDAVSMSADGHGSYTVRAMGKEFAPDEILHFVLNPDPAEPWRGTGYKASIADAVRGIRQSDATRRALMESPAPSLIVKVDGLSEEYWANGGQQRLRNQWFDAKDNGQIWFTPAEAIQVEQVKPLTLNDLAVAKNMELDKRAIASVFGVPPFLLGIGEFRREEYRLFVSTRLMTVAKTIEQELTRKLLLSPELYWKFNPRSLYNYDMSELVSTGVQLIDRMAMKRNELRDWLGLSPDEEMDELLALENYIPVSELANQNKLNGGGDGGGEKNPDNN